MRSTSPTTLYKIPAHSLFPLNLLYFDFFHSTYHSLTFFFFLVQLCIACFLNQNINSLKEDAFYIYTAALLVPRELPGT